MRRVLIGAALSAVVVLGGLTLAPDAAAGGGGCVQAAGGGDGGHHHEHPCPTTTSTTVAPTTTVPPPQPCTGNPATDDSGCPIDDCALPPGNQPPECEPVVLIPPVVLSREAVPVVAEPHTTG